MQCHITICECMDVNNVCWKNVYQIDIGQGQSDWSQLALYTGLVSVKNCY